LNQKYINYLLTGIILFASVLSFYFYEKGLYFDKKENFKANYKSNFLKDSIAITANDFLLNLSSQAEIEKSEFNISISKKDTLLYWNKEFDPTKAKTSILKNFSLNGLRYNITLDGSQSYIARVPFYDFIIFWVWILGLFFISIWAFHLDEKIKWFQNSDLKNTVALSAGIISIIYLISFFSGKYLFEFSTLFRVGNLSGYGISLWQFAINLIAISFILMNLHKSNVRSWLNEIKPSVRYFLSSLAISTLVYYLIACIESIIEASLVEIKTEELLNISYSEFTFFVLITIHLFLVIYLARQFFFGSSQNIRVWEKTIYFCLPLFICTLAFMFCGFKTNTIGVVLFIMVLFLLLDLYFEYFEINLSFLLSSVMIFSVFASSLIFRNASRIDDAVLSNTINHIYKPLDKLDLIKFKAINDSVVSSTLFPSLSELPYPQNIDVKDLKSFITKQIKQLQSYRIGEIYCYDKKGNSIALNQISNRDNINNMLSISEEISQHLYYSPIDGKPLLHYIIDNKTEVTNPIYLTILFDPKTKIDIKLPYKTSLAVYRDNSLIKAFNEDGYYPKTLNNDNKKGYFEVKKIGDYNIVRKEGKLFLSKFLPLVTFFISILGILVLIFISMNSIFHFANEKHHLSFNTKKSLRSRFQTIIIGLILLSFSLIGLTSAFYYNKLYDQKNTESFTILLGLITKDIQAELPELEEARNDARLEKIFSRLQNMYPLPFAFYDGEGQKIMETNEFYNAPDRLLKSHLKQLVQENKQKNIKVLSNLYSKNQVIIPVYNSLNNITGCFLTEDGKKDARYAGLFDFISTLLTVCVFLFLTALALSMIISTPMTQSLKNLAQRLKTFKLGKSNEGLEWKNPDEIGALIENFNKMQVELNQSADLLTKTQRDLAWREMAKQVAHEIKNPLTPMKLSIQHMQMAAKSADEDKMKSLISKTSTTILEQIENLTQIADEFSSFGTLPKASNDTIILNEVVEHIHDLFRKREDMDISMDEPMNDIYIFADKNQLVRILNNVVKNATQSIGENVRGKINIELNQNDQMAIIKVSDNGIGISDQMKEKVFTPNFTTKSSGTGLGLAISANMIESMNGKIYFNSPNEMNGTDFFIELPLVRTVSNNDEEVSLD
jgi:two-component system, NtrC family, nitrogen regulation sensor histidine kinase NtrY